MVLRDSAVDLKRRQIFHDNAPNGGWGWVVTFSGFMGCAILDGISYSFGLFFTELLTYFNESKSLTSWIISVFTGTYLAIGPLTSILVSIFGIREVTSFGAILASLSMFMCSFSPSIRELILSFGLFAGFGFGLIYLSAIVAVGQYFTSKRALATGISLSGSGVGTFVLSLLIKFLIEQYGWKGAMWVLSGIALNRVPLGLLLRPLPDSEKPVVYQIFNSARNKEENTDQTSNSIHKIQKCKTHKLFDLKLMKSISFLFYGCSCFLCMLGFYIPYVFIPDMVVQMGMTSSQAAIFISVIGAFSSCGRIASGVVVDRQWLNCTFLNGAALLLAGAVTLCVPYYVRFEGMVVYCAIFGAAIAVFVSLRSIILAELLGIEKLSSALGLVTLCQGVATIIGAPLAGALADSSGSYHSAFIMAGSTFIGAGLLCLPLRKIRDWEYRPTESDEESEKDQVYTITMGMRRVNTKTRKLYAENK